MSTERDELAEEIAGYRLGEGYYAVDIGSSDALAIADDILAAGYRKPRVVTTAEELDQLHMVVVRTTAGTIANIVSGRAYCFGYEASAPVGSLSLPVTVLWEADNV